MKNLIRITLLLLFSLVLVSCNGEIAITLDTPQNVAISDGVVTWDAVTDATGYTVIVNSNTYTVTATTFDLNTLDLPAGTYPVHIIATQGLNVSEPSTTLNFIVQAISVGVPQNVAINEGVVTWNAVSGATGYVVHVGSQTHTVTATTFDLTTLSLTQGNYTVYVVAMIGTDASANSTSLSYFVGGSTLDIPQNVTIQSGIVTWDAVSGADGYVVYVDSTSYTVTATTFDLTSLTLSSGDHEVFVIAKAGTDYSLGSTHLNYFIESADVAAIYASALAVIDPSYEPDMTEDDFEYSYEYKDYRQMSQMVYAFSVASTEIGMNQLEALGLFTYIASTPVRMASISDLSSMMTEIESYSAFDMDTGDLAIILYELAQAAIAMHIDDLNYDILEYQDDIDNLELQLDTYQDDLDFTSLRTMLAPYATTEELVQLDYFLSGEYVDTLFIINTVPNMAFNITYDYAYDFNSDDQYLLMFESILLAAKAAEDYTTLNYIANNAPLSQLYTIGYIFSDIGYKVEYIEERSDEILMMNEIATYFMDQKTFIIDSLIGVVDYLSLVYDTIPTSLVGYVDDLITNGELTMEEYFMLKDEVVDVLQLNLPTSEEFGSVYTTIFTVAEAFGLATVADYQSYTTFLGQVDHAALDIALTFIAELDQTTVEDVMAIVEEMIIPGEEYYDEYWDEWLQESPTVDFEKAIELAVYVGTYLDGFKTDFAAKFDALDALSQDEQVEELMNLLAGSIKAAMALEMDPEEYEMISMVIDEVLANYADIIVISDMVNAVGMNIVDEFLTTSGQMFLDAYALINTGSGDLSDPTFITALQAVLVQAIEYKSAMLDQFDLESIESILTVASIPLKFALMMQTEMEMTDIELLLESLIIPMSAALDLGFTFINYIDDQTIIDIALLVNEMIIPGHDVYDEFDNYLYYESSSIDFEVAIEFAVYLGNYLGTFKTDNSAKFDAVNAMFTDGQIEDLLTLIADIAKTIIEPEMDPLDYLMAEMIIDELIADYDVMISALEVAGTIGSDVIDQFLTTNGQVLLDLYDIILNGSGDFTSQTFVAELEALFSQMLVYNNIVMDDLDLTSIQAMLQLVRVPLKVIIMNEFIMDPEDFDLLFDALFVPVSTVIFNVIHFEKALTTSVDNLAVETLLFDSDWTITGDVALMAIVVLALDNTLTLTNKALFTTTLNLVGTILKNATVMEMMGTVATTDVDDMISSLNTQFNDIFDEIDAIAAFDFTTTLDQTQIDRINALFNTQLTLPEPPA
ncbi:MAG: hypothetical protein JXC31_06280 [Acholeplasmataceae bacterium]|nr:hypothetical protein [Acholeplasmataceae bacterium]